MGIRCTQIIGLNERAEQLIEGEEILLYDLTEKRRYPDGREEALPPRPVFGSSVSKEVCGVFYGMFEEEYPLHRYTLPSGEIYEERVQAEPWSSGPCIFLALICAGGEVWQPQGAPADSWLAQTLWSEAEINSSL